MSAQKLLKPQELPKRPYGPKEPLEAKGSSWSEQYPFEQNYFEMQHEGKPLYMNVVDEGPKNAPVILFLHGNPTWSFIWRHAINALKKTHRCIAIDHIGCGFSDRPQSYDYTLSQHAQNVHALLEYLEVKTFFLVMHDWGGMIGMKVATDKPERVVGFSAMNTGAFMGPLPPSIASIKVPWFGKTAVLQFNAFVRVALKRCIHKKERLTEAIKEAYTQPYNNPHDRLATLRFVEDVPQSDAHPTASVVKSVDQKLHLFKEKPALLIWGEEDFCFSPVFRKGWQERFPKAITHTFDDASHYIFEEYPDEVATLLQEFIRENHPS